MMFGLKKLFRFLQKLININQTPYFGFVQGHSHISQIQFRKINSLIGFKSARNNLKFEREFARYMGVETATSFASGRMGFYALLQTLGIQAGDEVILTGSTCAVMANAVLRTGAKPIYADISTKTFGTCPISVKELISEETRVIVAQHSFGIPCDIDDIVEFTKENEIFLIEDCALTFDSSLNGTKVGLFGDASLFSFDHTKPINTMIGGMICTNKKLGKKLKKIQERSHEIPLDKRKLLFKKFKTEKQFCNPRKFSQFQFIELIESKIREIFCLQTPFLTDDSSSDVIKKSSYPYPARMPEFLSFLGLIELKRWIKIKDERKQILKKYITFFHSIDYLTEIDATYLDVNRDIIPLRFVWKCKSGWELRDRMKNFLQIERIWFKKPIVDTNEPLENFQYVKGSCKISESLGSTVINLPTSISLHEADELINKLSSLIK